jgi:diguanylate cyclase (GGDEF)-like protein
MTGDDLRFRAALSRIGVALIAIVLLPIFYPGTRSYVWIWVAYLALSCVGQVLIHKGIGGEARAFVSGIVDLGVLTFTVHRLGSTATPMASLYFFAGVANALVVHRRVAAALAAIGVVAYDGLVWAEWGGLLPFAPDVPQLAALAPPSFGQAALATIFVTTFVVAATAIVGTLVHAVQRREELLLRANTQLEDLSQRDPLTNLYNRRHLFARLEAELARVRRGHPLAVLMIDLDGFKRVNDAQGHLRGDVLLKEIAGALSKTTREVDVAGRYGGDEFVLVLPDTDVAQARAAAERVVQCVREVGERIGGGPPITASLGLAVASQDDSVAAVLRRADENAYRAKQGGGDRVVA